MDLKNVIYTGSKDKSIYNCFEQQIMTLCYFFYNEYWKLFIENSITCTKEERRYIDEIIEFNTNISIMATKYYGIQCEPIPCDSELTFDKDQIYFIIMNLQDYPYTQKIEEEGEHCFLIYGKSHDGYLVNDVYYNVTDFTFDVEQYEKAKKSVYRVIVQPDFKPLSDYKNQVIQKLKCNYYDEIEKVRKIVKEKELYDYHSSLLFDRVQLIYSFIKKDVLLVENNYMVEPYMKVCLNILDEVANNIKKVWFSLIKSQLKYETIPRDKIEDKFEEISRYLEVEKRVKNEIIQLLLAKDSLKERLEQQLLEYLEVDKVDDTRSIYEDHEGLAVMLLINYWEEKNENVELDYILYKELQTYGQYKLVTYENILRGGM
ncbi:hypothetical protein [Anaerosporobacter faecicola]|uniref:hypothetical protein n=1 Tax=Anaerosporobacter faecicola TaxID=2718714 RepID=UPI00143C8F66|nr:hypothetical protein [Anaerosporobacter faecicola]